MRSQIITLNSESHFPEGIEIQQIVKEITSDKTGRLIVAVDGVPGVGKSTIAKILRKYITQMGISVGLVATDLDCLPWSERPKGSSIIDWAGSELTREVLENPGASFTYNGYDSVSHERTLHSKISTPKEGILILEGITSIERAFEYGKNDPIVALNINISREFAEMLRIQRNIEQRRWKASEAQSRTAQQRGQLKDYYSNDLDSFLTHTSQNIRKCLRNFKVSENF